MGLSFFPFAKCKIMRKGYKVMDSFSDRLPSFVPPLCFTELRRPAALCHVSFIGLPQFVLSTFKGEEALQACVLFWNPRINRGLEKEF